MTDPRTVYLVIEVTGAHEPAAVCAIWTTRKAADADAAHRNAERGPLAGYGYEVAEARLDEPAPEGSWN